MIKRMSVAAFLLAVVLFASPAFAGDGDVFLYNDAVARDIDVGKFVTTGEIEYLEGVGKFCDITDVPLPDGYPRINIWEPGFEQLGLTNIRMDGIWFVNLGGHWVKNRLALVLWKIRIPDANQRTASEFEQDLSLSMWIDWDQDESWDKGELEIRDNVNLANCFPTEDETVCVYYLTCFRVPDVTQMASSDWWWWKKWNKEIRYFWTRCNLSFDDPDVSPDGEQLFGEIEDYRVSYMVIEKKKKGN